MSKVIVSVVLAAGLVGAIVVGVSRGGDSDSSDVASQISPGISAIRGEIATLHDEIAALSDSVQSLRDSQERIARDSRSVPVPASAVGATSGSGEAVPTMSSADLHGFVAAVLEEQERVKDENREREREEARVRTEERKREIAALSEGPYDRYNLKINSLGNVLSMSDAQKQGYFELTTAYREKVEQTMKELREQRSKKETEASEGENGETRDRRRGGGDRGDRDSYREAFNGIQEEFNADMQQLLGANQFATYSELSRDARSVFDRDQVFAVGEERRGRSSGGRSFGGRSSGGRGGGGRGR